MKVQAEQSEERTNTFESALKRSKQHLDAAIHEKEGLIKKIAAVEEQITISDRKREDLREKLNGLISNTDVSECKRKVLENRELEGDETMVKLEERLAYSKNQYKEHAVRCEEAERRLQILKEEFNKVHELRMELENKGDYMEEEIDEAITKMRDLENKEGDAIKKEYQSDDQIKLLDSYYREAEERKEMARYDVCRLQRLIDQTNDDIERVQMNTRQVQHEMEKAIAEVMGDN